MYSLTFLLSDGKLSSMALTTCQRISSVVWQFFICYLSVEMQRILYQPIQYKLSSKPHKIKTQPKKYSPSGNTLINQCTRLSMRKEKRPKKAGFYVNSRIAKQFRVVYLAFLLPFILTWLSWAYLPVVAHWIVANLFGYKVAEQTANPIWLGLIVFFCTWYTLLAIGLAGTWAVGALL